MQRRVRKRKPRVLLASIVVCLLAALVALLVTLLFVWKLLAHHKLHVRTQKSRTHDCLNRRHVRILLFLVVVNLSEANQTIKATRFENKTSINCGGECRNIWQDEITSSTVRRTTSKFAGPTTDTSVETTTKSTVGTTNATSVGTTTPILVGNTSITTSIV